MSFYEGQTVIFNNNIYRVDEYKPAETAGRVIPVLVLGRSYMVGRAPHGEVVDVNPDSFHLVRPVGDDPETGMF